MKHERISSLKLKVNLASIEWIISCACVHDLIIGNIHCNMLDLHRPIRHIFYYIFSLETLCMFFIMFALRLISQFICLVIFFSCLYLRIVCMHTISALIFIYLFQNLLTIANILLYLQTTYATCYYCCCCSLNSLIYC